ncbi:MAG: bifunctional lysylphosphatidylglycerol flippase/synthetase MprF [Labedaea sp.]
MRKWVWPFGLVAGLFATAAALVALRLQVPLWLRPASHDAAASGAARLHGALLAVLLVVLARGLLGRRRVAYGVGVVAAIVGALALGPGLPAVLLVVTAVLLALRPAEFTAVPVLARVRTAMAGGLVVLAAGGIYDVAMRWDTHMRADLLSLLLLAASTVLVVLMAPAPAPPPATESTRALVRGLAANPASGTLAPFALRRDKAYVFSPDGRAALGYRVLFGVAVAGGDPVGHPGSYAAAVDAFVRRCARDGWRPAVIGVRAELAGMWHAHGLRSIGIGDEVVLEVAGFSLERRRMRNVRQAVARTHNAGVSTRIAREGELPARLRTELAEVSSAWLRGSRERGFSMILDGLLNGVHPECLLVIAYDRTGRVVGFQRYATCCGGTALSLDTMRRDRDGPNGLNERMIVDVLEYCATAGIEVLSLNFAAFRTLLDAGDARRVVDRLGYRAMHLLDPLIQLESLYLFNAKFRPSYRPRSVAFPSWWSIPTVAAVMLTLEFAPGGVRRLIPQPEPVLSSSPTSSSSAIVTGDAE